MKTVEKLTRSEIMSRVGQKDTGPEMLLRSALHKQGLRYCLHDRRLPGSPDLVFPRFHAVVFVHGCYWHSHGCYRSSIPKTRHKFWTKKFEDNRNRDKRNIESLLQNNWRVMVVWECALIGKNSLPAEKVARQVRIWLCGTNSIGKIERAS